jgi:toxin HigB-1
MWRTHSCGPCRDSSRHLLVSSIYLVRVDMYGITVHNRADEMQLTRFRHKGLKQLYEDGTARGVQHTMADKLQKLLFALETADSLDQLSLFPGWKLHPLTGNRKGFWSLTVTGNWRLIFHYDQAANTASDIDLIDYH